MIDIESYPRSYHVRGNFATLKNLPRVDPGFEPLVKGKTRKSQ